MYFLSVRFSEKRVCCGTNPSGSMPTPVPIFPFCRAPRRPRGVITAQRTAQPTQPAVRRW